MLTWEMAYRLRFERGLILPFNGEFEDHELKCLAIKQAQAFEVILETDKIILKKEKERLEK